MRLDGKVAVVTGAASGMGKAIAEKFAKEGAKVVAVALNLEGVQSVANDIESNGGVATAVSANVSKREDIENMIDLAVDKFGTLDILVNNAGIMDKMEPVVDVEDENWDQIINVNTKGVMMGMRKTIPIFLEKESGVIINTASTGGLNGAHAGSTYTASKHAVIGLTKNTEYMYAQNGIRCNAIAPGAVETNIMANMQNINEFGASRTDNTQSGVPRAGSPEEIADVALFLASDDSRFVNGAVVVADAGWTAAF